MRSGQCPKCDGTEIYRATATKSWDLPGITADGRLTLQIYTSQGLFGGGTSVYLTHYLCRQCGYTEMYAEDAQALANLDAATNWQHVEAGRIPT
jgi:predicted nucleic-acid-binding Zn-ribbon protein